MLECSPSKWHFVAFLWGIEMPSLGKYCRKARFGKNKNTSPLRGFKLRPFGFSPLCKPFGLFGSFANLKNVFHVKFFLPQFIAARKYLESGF